MLKGKNIIITGANGGIGRACVEIAASYGADIWACARKPSLEFEDFLNSLKKIHNVNVLPIYFDFEDNSQIKEAVKLIRSSKKSIDAICNIAGIVDESTSFEMTSVDKIKKVFNINFFAMTEFLQYIVRIMERQNFGAIVNVSSIAGIDGEPGQYEYAASKAAIIGATKELARELAKNNIRVNAVAPGIVDTKMGAKISEELKAKVIDKVILQRLAQPAEIANMILFLASDLSSYVTGQVIRVDGGM